MGSVCIHSAGYIGVVGDHCRDYARVPDTLLQSRGFGYTSHEGVRAR
jgi:hypothetical protein